MLDVHKTHISYPQLKFKGYDDIKPKLKYKEGETTTPLENDLLYQEAIKQLKLQKSELARENINLRECVEKYKKVKENILEKQSSFIVKSSICSLFLGATTFSFIFSILGMINWKPTIAFVWLVLSLGAWLTNFVNIENWKSKNVE